MKRANPIYGVNVRPTRFPELGFRQDAPRLWRIIDKSTGAAVGPHYVTRAELLGDLARFADVFGCGGSPSENSAK